LWRNNTNGQSHWRVISRDNVTSIYGQSRNSRSADPADNTCVFSWLLELSYDDKGRIIIYEYKPEDSTNVARSLHEEHRSVTANRYLKRMAIILHIIQTNYQMVQPHFPQTGAFKLSSIMATTTLQFRGSMKIATGPAELMHFSVICGV
jgi:Salmonella virulence plasmid 65kDa B protein